MMAIRKQLTKLLIGICMLIGVTVFFDQSEVKEMQTVRDIEKDTFNDNDTFVYDGTNAAAYKGESVFVITDQLNTDLIKIQYGLTSVKMIIVDDAVTYLPFDMLRFFEEATALHIGRKVSSIYLDTENNLKMLSTIDVDIENQYFTAVDNVLYSLDMKTLYLYPAGKTDKYFSIPDTVINLKIPYIENSSLQDLEIGKAFGPLDAPYGDNSDSFYSFTDGLSSLQKITVDIDNAYLSAENGVLYDKDKTKTIVWPRNLVMEYITFPSDLQSITLGMISNKEQVKTITLSKGMEELWVADFISLLIGFPNLEAIFVPEENEHYTVWKGGLYKKENWIFCGFPQKSPLTTLEFPEGCTGIELRDSQYPNIDTIILPSTFSGFNTHEGGGYAEFCQLFPELRSIQISSECKKYKSVENVVYNKKGTKLIAYPSQKGSSSYKIPDSVKNIMWGVFFDSTKLKTLTIGMNLEEYQRWDGVMGHSSISVFKTVKNCKNYTCEDGVLYDKNMTRLEAYPPYKNAADYEVPDTVTDITSLYNAKSIENLILGKKVENLCDFSTLKNLKSITVSKDNTFYMSKNGILYDKKGAEVIYNPKK
jgi:hypothetical protein